MRDYRNIIAWQLADRLVKQVYSVTKTFPREEKFGLISQIRRAAVSVACNIVEGSNRKMKRDYARFLHISKGSLSETGYLIGLSRDLNYIENDNYVELDALYQEASATLYGLIQSVENEI